MDRLEEIKLFYAPEYKETMSTSYYLTVNGEKKLMNLRGLRKVILNFGAQIKTEEEAKAIGSIITTEEELGKALFSEEWEKIRSKYEPDERTKKYLSAVKQNIGLLRIEGEEEGDGLEFDKIKEISVWINAYNVVIGKNKKEEWIAEYCVKTDESYAMIDYIYNRKPSEKVILTTRLLEDIDFYFSINGWDKTTFRCWECGRELYWLDIEGDLSTKWIQFKDKYCGC
jgi:hypothetical protein